ncbi:hypothetical protein AOLI_G00002660 [Acnodon oligacanthus]
MCMESGLCSANRPRQSPLPWPRTFEAFFGFFQAVRLFVTTHLYTNDCASKEPAVKGLIANSDDSAYRKEVVELVFWCSSNHLLLNIPKTVEMVVAFSFLADQTTFWRK